MTGLEQVGSTFGSPLSCQNSVPRAAALGPLPRCRAGHGKAQVCQVQRVLVLAFHDGEAQSVRPLPGGMRPVWPRKFPGGGGERFRILNKGFDFIISSSFKCSDTWKCTSCLRSTERPHHCFHEQQQCLASWAAPHLVEVWDGLGPEGWLQLVWPGLVRTPGWRRRALNPAACTALPQG